MGVMDQINDLKGKGFSEQQIINKLSDESYSPKEINDALSRSKIKSAVSSNASDPNSNTKGMQPSIMNKNDNSADDYNYGLEAPKPSQSSNKGPKTKEVSEDYYPSSQGQGQSYYPQDQNQDYQGSQYDYSGGQGYVTDTDTMIEVAEQVFAEKMKPVLKQIEDTLEFKKLSESKLENVSDRLKRLESQIDKLQAAILEKVGSYGRGLDDIKKEMNMVEDSFSKVAGNLLDENEKASHKHKHKKTSKSKKKKSSSRKKRSKK